MKDFSATEYEKQPRFISAVRLMMFAEITFCPSINLEQPGMVLILFRTSSSAKLHDKGSKIQQLLKFLAFKTCPNCIDRSWNSSTERPERQLHSCCEPPCLQQSNFNRRPILHETISHLCLGKTRHARFLRFVYACTMN